MKKTYVKPEIMFESFASSTNIAGNCSEPTNTPVINHCAYIVKDENLGMDLPIFLSSMTEICEYSEVLDGEDEAYNGVCYYTPFEKSLFNS